MQKKTLIFGFKIKEIIHWSVRQCAVLLHSYLLDNLPAKISQKYESACQSSLTIHEPEKTLSPVWQQLNVV